MKKNKLSGFTLIEMIFVLVLGSALSIGIFIIFLSSTKQLNQDHVLNDLKSYASLSMGIISEKIRNADQIAINTTLGSSMITITNNIDSNTTESFVYTVTNNAIYENSMPMKLYGFHWLDDQDLYEIDIQLQCSTNNLTFFESGDGNLNSNIYDLAIIINIASKIDEEYEMQYETNNRIFSINKYSQIL